jgi:hypothetical protein
MALSGNWGLFYFCDSITSVKGESACVSSTAPWLPYGDLSVLLPGHDLEPAFTTDVTRFAADDAHVAGEIGKRNCFKMCRLFTLCMQQGVSLVA